MDYSLEKQPFIAVGQRGKGNCDDCGGLALDESSQLIYVADLPTDAYRWCP